MWKLKIIQEKTYTEWKHEVETVFTSDSLPALLSVVERLEGLTAEGTTTYKIEKVEEKAGE